MALTPHRSETYTSLIQGISQQSDIARGTASSADQENCLNEVLDGVVSRMGTRLKAFYPDSLSAPFVHEIKRNSSERYLVIIEGGNIKIINRADNAVCSISSSGLAYLGVGSEVARERFQAVSIGDTTFILNREVVVQMANAQSASRPNKGMIYFRAGGYSVTYSMSLTVGGNTYSASYETPDNSDSDNAQYITTTNLATQFLTNLNDTIFPAMVADGVTGFAAVLVGSVIIIEGPSGVTFDLSSSDGVGDTHMKALMDSVKTISDLPAQCVDGYELSVSPNGGQAKERYFLQYQGSATTGRWVEVVAPDTKLGLDASTLPLVLTNTAYNSFTIGPASWGQRLSGDGENTSKEPSFIGRSIKSLKMISGRLAFCTDYSAILSRARNAYVFFPDTAQTSLDTDPIDYDVSNGTETIITNMVAAGGKLQFWGDKQQTYLESGQEAIKETTTDILPLANYDFDGQYPPKPVGLTSIMFGTAIGRWAKVTEVFFSGSKAQGEITITAHVPKLLDGGLRCIAPGESATKAIFLTLNQTNVAYLYQWYNQGSDRVQSAWNRWTFPATSLILWAGIDGDSAEFLFKWANGFSYETVKLDGTGDEDSVSYPLRLDHRLFSSSATFSTDHWELSLPFSVPEGLRSMFTAYVTLGADSGYQRGLKLEVEWVSSQLVHIKSSDANLQFVFGTVPTSSRRFSRFYARDNNQQPILHDKLLVRTVRVAHKETVEYDVVVHKADGSTVTQTYTGRVLGDPTIRNIDTPVKTGNFLAKVNSETEDSDIELVNKTPFPSVWSAIKYTYELTVAVP